MARPATGQTPVMSFRPPKPLRDKLKALAKSEGRSESDALIEAMHDWVTKKEREHGGPPTE